MQGEKIIRWDLRQTRKGGAPELKLSASPAKDPNVIMLILLICTKSITGRIIANHSGIENPPNGGFVL